eukprot:SAG31_NODE_506_length_14749_cov_8.119181_6_plen_84_part_00
MPAWKDMQLATRLGIAVAKVVRLYLVTHPSGWTSASTKGSWSSQYSCLDKMQVHSIALERWFPKADRENKSLDSKDDNIRSLD